MSLRGGRTSRRHLHRTAFGAVQVSNLLALEKARLTSFAALWEIASGKERPRKDIVSLVGEETYIFTNRFLFIEHLCYNGGLRTD